MSALILVLYVCGWIAVAVMVTRYALTELRGIGASGVDASDYVMCGFMGLLLGMVWPLALPVASIVVAAEWPRRAERKAEKRRDALRDQATRERDIARLERELGIGQ